MSMKMSSEFPAVGKRAQVVFTGPTLMKTPPLTEFVVLSKFPTLDGAGEIVVGHSDGRHTEHLETYGLFSGVLMLWTGSLWKTLDAAVIPRGEALAAA